MLLLLVTTLVIWTIPATKIAGVLAVWHVLLAATLFVTILARPRITALIRVIVVNIGMVLLLILLPTLMIIRDAYEGGMAAAFDPTMLRGIGGLLYALCLAAYSVHAKDRRKILLLLCVVFSLQAVVGILQYFAPETFFGLPELLASNVEREPQGYVGRVRGLFTNVHIFGQCMLGLFSFFIPLVFLLEKEQLGSIQPRIYFGLTLLVGALSILLTYLRAAYAGLLLDGITVTYYLTKGEKRLRRAFALLGVGAAAVGLAAWMGLFQASAAGRFSKGYLSMGDIMRIESLKAAYSTFYESPFFGASGVEAIFDIGVHNILMSSLAFYGIAGLLLYLLFFGGLFMKMRELPQPWRPYKIGLLLWLITLLGYGMSHTSAFWIGGGLHEWTFVGLLLGLVTANRLSRADSDRVTRARPGAPTATGSDRGFLCGRF